MRFTFIVALLAWLPAVAVAGPKISIGSLSDYLQADKGVLVKRVFNGGDATAFVKVRAWELLRKADGTVEEVALDIEAGGGERELVVSPTRLIIPASGMQTVRLLFDGQRDRERYFRLRFNPVLPSAGDGFELTEQEAEAYEVSIAGGVQMLAGFGSLLYVRPRDVMHQLEIDDQLGRFVVRNVGNATAVLERFRRCDASGIDCDPAVVHHLPPGSTRAFAKTPNSTYAFEHRRGALAPLPYEIKG
ncbi:molecular chaperone [Pseudomonas sp. RIT-PI-S]|uniref:molecular chaperone n=1 Tax=Pseudomonas sp. RIT-PI-S TaxID=3035295 RepID=UPI0021DB5D75|nr:molecular chaperone [Pseudomonas sp. RIT-PI-S]